MKGAVIIRVTGIWGVSDDCKQHNRRWWMETICYNEYGGSDERYWEVDWVLTKEGKPTGMNHLFWKEICPASKSHSVSPFIILVQKVHHIVNI